MAEAQEMRENPPEIQFYRLTMKDVLSIEANLPYACQPHIKTAIPVMLRQIFADQDNPGKPTRSDIVRAVHVAKAGLSSFNITNVQHLANIIRITVSRTGKKIDIRCIDGKPGYYRFIRMLNDQGRRKLAVVPVNKIKKINKKPYETVGFIRKRERMHITRALWKAHIINMRLESETKGSATAKMVRNAYPNGVETQKILDDIWGFEVGQKPESKQALTKIIENIRQAVKDIGFDLLIEGENRDQTVRFKKNDLTS